MINFNNKIILPSRLTMPSYSFDATYRTLIFRNRDTRDIPKLKYTLNGTTYEGHFDRRITYDLPSIDTEYQISFVGIPTDSKYKGYSKIFKIFKNHPDCKDFIYGDKTSTVISGYKGTNNTITVPNKYNLNSLTEVNITSFPNVKGDISLTVESEISKFWIKDSKLKEINVKCLTFAPEVEQFSELTNLTKVEFAKPLTSCPDKMFYKCSSVNINPNATKNITQFGDQAFFDTRSQKSIRFAGTRLESGVFDYSSTGVQKSIFTSANSVNGLTNDDIPYGTFTDGMLYNYDKKHQVYCNVTDSVWRDTSATVSTITNNGYNGSTTMAPDDTFVLTPDDSNVFGLDIVVYDENGKEINHTQNIKTPGNFSLLDSHLYGKNMDTTNVVDLKYKEDKKVSLYDRFHITTIDNTGLMETSIQSPYGEIAPEPKYRIRRIFSLDGGTLDSSKTFTLTCLGYSFNVSVPKRKVYEYILCDINNTNICMARIVMRDAQTGIDVGLNGKALQHPKLTLVKNFGSYGLYMIDATQYYNYQIYTTGSHYDYPDMGFFYRDYRYGYVNEEAVTTLYDSSLGHPAGTSTREPAPITVKYPEFDKWYDIWPNGIEINGTPSFNPQKAFFTTEDNSTLILNGKVYATGVPKGTLGVLVDSVNCPKIRYKLEIVRAPDSTSDDWRYETFIRNKVVDSNLIFINLFELGLTENEILNSIYNTYNKYSPSLRIGYANNNFAEDIDRFITIYYTNNAPSSGGNATLYGTKLEFTTEEVI